MVRGLHLDAWPQRSVGQQQIKVLLTTGFAPPVAVVNEALAEATAAAYLPAQIELGRPVLNIEIRNPGHVLDVRRNQDGSGGPGVSCDRHVEVFDSLT